MARIKDRTMPRHNVYNVVAGARFGSVFLRSISPQGVLLSDGRLLVPRAPTTLASWP